MRRAAVEQTLERLPDSISKLYDAVPIAEKWSVSQVHMEAKRLGICNSYSTTHWRIHELVKAGLVSVTKGGLYSRIKVTEPKEGEIDMPAPVVLKGPPVVTTLAPAQKATPADKLMDLCARCAAMMDSLKVLADDIGNTAIEIDEQMRANAADAEKLRTLQAMLKGL